MKRHQTKGGPEAPKKQQTMKKEVKITKIGGHSTREEEREVHEKPEEVSFDIIDSTRGQSKTKVRLEDKI